jgi:hypothetical protein
MLSTKVVRAEDYVVAVLLRGAAVLSEALGRADREYVATESEIVHATSFPGNLANGSSAVLTMRCLTAEWGARPNKPKPTWDGIEAALRTTRYLFVSGWPA